ncbi:ABC transporter permease [Candidatus Nitrosotenuis sp. DW1]|uniref:ABC transporter permease n=1 Tax=Candidatus Nitrosotenuis sp. DW1 TaxID=2259672 RepID=UPI0021029A0D|nr:ABC transporter permease [Candidatus Nitrosotenuis sp. DW1]
MGAGILLCLVLISAFTIVFIPLDTYKQWNNPSSWTLFPKSALPSWVNVFLAKKIPEHQILDNTSTTVQTGDNARKIIQSFETDYAFDYFPSDFIYQYTAKYQGTPVLEFDVTRPDGMTLHLSSYSLPDLKSRIVFSDKVFSTNESIRKNILLASDRFAFSVDSMPVEEVVFSKTDAHEVLKGKYTFVAKISTTDAQSSIQDSKLIIGGKVFGLIGTDEQRRDLAIGLLWGTPLALFIGITVSVVSVASGLIYGVFAGYKGGKTDESMMRFNDIIYALPALPFLIILAVTISNSIFLTIGFLMIFGWVGIAKVSRSMALQIKNRQFVEASKAMGQKSSKIIFKHIIPQIMPYALASIAISVPAAITTEAGLSFLGLGDPSFPTWGQILHDASTHGAVTRGLWWWVIPPGIMITITGLAFVFVGNSLDNLRIKR